MGLRKFTESELLFDEAETRLILKFIFKNKHSLIDGMQITNKVREFAQGLLVEAVDASYALGYVEALFRATANPAAGVRKILKKFAKKAIKHWFKHATADNLMDIKIYEVVRNQLAYNFGRILVLHSNGLAKKSQENAAYVAYQSTMDGSVAWA
jgi:hypothetical protein